MEYVILTVIVFVVLYIASRKVYVSKVVFEHEKGLMYKNGKFFSLLEPGKHWYMPYKFSVTNVDVRPRFSSITGQEVLSSDGVSLKLSLAANFEIKDPYVAINKVQSFDEALYVEIQLALREIIGKLDIESILNSRDEISSKLMESVSPKMEGIGINLISVNIKDIMFPGKLKDIFAQVVNARQEGLAALEKARGESAALRNLANAAKMIETNPNLMNLRLLQAIGESKGNTFVLGLPNNTTVLPVKDDVKE